MELTRFIFDFSLEPKQIFYVVLLAGYLLFHLVVCCKEIGRRISEFSVDLAKAYNHATLRQDLHDQFEADLFKEFFLMVNGVGGVLLLYSLILVANNAKMIVSVIISYLDPSSLPIEDYSLSASIEQMTKGVMGFCAAFCDPVVFWCFGAFPAGLYLIVLSTGFQRLADLAGNYSVVLNGVVVTFIFICAAPIILFLMACYLVGGFFLAILYTAGLFVGAGCIGFLIPCPICGVICFCVLYL